MKALLSHHHQIQESSTFGRVCEELEFRFKYGGAPTGILPQFTNDAVHSESRCARKKRLASFAGWGQDTEGRSVALVSQSRSQVPLEPAGCTACCQPEKLMLVTQCPLSLHCWSPHQGLFWDTDNISPLQSLRSGTPQALEECL